MKTEWKQRLKRLLIGWLVCSCLVVLVFVGFWLWHGMPKGPEGVVATWAEAIAVSAAAPPLVWAIGKLAIG